MPRKKTKYKCDMCPDVRDTLRGAMSHRWKAHGVRWGQSATTRTRASAKEKEIIESLAEPQKRKYVRKAVTSSPNAEATNLLIHSLHVRNGSKPALTKDDIKHLSPMDIRSYLDSNDPIISRRKELFKLYEDGAITFLELTMQFNKLITMADVNAFNNSVPDKNRITSFSGFQLGS